MSTTAEREQHKDLERQKHATLSTRIGAQVIHILGEPAGLHMVQVRPLWEDHYRVNVFIGADAASAKVANSYFLKADSDGNIIASTPTIRRQY
jgi:hypothetical protein